jgi:hypothetical protein
MVLKWVTFPKQTIVNAKMPKNPHPKKEVVLFIVLGEIFSITLSSWSVGSNVTSAFGIYSEMLLNLTFTSLNFSTCHKPLMINIHTSHNITLPNIHVTISHCLWSYLEPNDHICPTYMSQYYFTFGRL